MALGRTGRVTGRDRGREGIRAINNGRQRMKVASPK
jgi:hypothetical protein